MNETSRAKVLIVDDQRSIHDDFRKILGATTRSEDTESELMTLESELLGLTNNKVGETATFKVESAFQGEEALKLVQDAKSKGEPFALAFVDMRMPPGWDGMETCRRLWSVDPGLQVVICTAYSDYSWSEIVRGLGHSDRLLLLRKPFDPNEAWQLAVSLSEKARLAKSTTERMQDLEELSDHLEGVNEVLRDEINNREAMEERLLHMATHDSLTGLPNRMTLPKYVTERLELTQTTKEELALAFFDVDDFKLVNDSMGHVEGDALLKSIAQTIRDEGDVLTKDHELSSFRCFRLGGDEFVAVLTGSRSQDELEQAAVSLQQKIAVPRMVSDRELVVSVSVGLTFASGRQVKPDWLIREADTALYRAKTNGRALLAHFDDAMHETVVRRLRIENDLKKASPDLDFTLVYQPIFEPRCKELRAFEALLRWRGSDGGLISPTEFIPIAERSGAIASIGRWVLREACRQAAEWNELRPSSDPVSVNINVSRRQIDDADFIGDLEELVASGAANPAWVNLEITETAAIANVDSMVRSLRRIKALGFGIQMDDFGTGYSSLSCLHQLPLDVVKIDRAFTAALKDRPECSEIIRAVVTLARGIGMKVTAEGIEDQEQANQVRDLGCDYVQGFLLGAPRPASAAMELVRQHSDPVDQQNEKDNTTEHDLSGKS